MKQLLISIALTPVIYLTIALTLTLLPFKQQPVTEGLDFSVLDIESIAGIQATETSYTARDGSTLFLREITGGDELIIVLMHGSGSEGRYLVPLANALNETQNATVIVPDLRGHGESMLGAPGDVSYIGQLEHDVADLLSTLRAAYPNANILLGGHSSGGGLAVRYGGSSLPQFDGTILLAPYLGYQAPTVRENSGGWVQVSLRRYAGLAMFNNVRIRAFNATPVLFFNKPASVDDGLQVQHYSYRLNESFSPVDYATELETNAAPMITVIGTEDEALFATEFAPVYAQHAPQASLHQVVDAKHLDLVANPATADFITSWISQHSLGTGK